MKGSRSTAAALISLAVLGVALVVLGTLQYRWIGAMAGAERQRMRAGIEFAARHYSDDFDHELTRIFFSFQLPSPEATPEHFLRRYDEWAITARDPRLVRAIYFLPPGEGGLQLIDTAARSMHPVPWPESLAPLQSVIARADRERSRERPVDPIVPGLAVLVVPGGDLRRMIERHIAGMVAPGSHMKIPEPLHPGFTIIELDRDYIARVWLPDLTRRYFDTPHGRDYEVEVVAPESGRVIYRSDDGTTPFRADFELPIFNLRALRKEPEERMMAAEMPPPPPPQALWLLRVRHHSGTLDEIVGATRRRNLMLTGGILAVLAATVIALAAMLRGAERLRLQQMEFVAGVTHELNTPVAALTSAGQNLADGIITEPSQVARYGAAIVKESRRLTETIGQVLAYGGMQSRRKLPHAPVDVASVIEEGIATCRWMAEEQSVVIESHVDPDLPVVDGDAASLTRAIQNLIANATRHGAAGKWVGVNASFDGKSVAVTVEDRGPGIAARDMPHLFEPFYRGRGADRVRGSGLGLTIVKQIAAAHGGSVAVERRREGGAVFTLRLPARGAPMAAPEIAQHA
jgi:signal transduction histidine kinase